MAAAICAIVIVAELGLPMTPPDVYAHVEANPAEVGGDDCHPDNTGYQSMTDLWRDALLPWLLSHAATPATGEPVPEKFWSANLYPGHRPSRKYAATIRHPGVRAGRQSHRPR